MPVPTAFTALNSSDYRDVLRLYQELHHGDGATQDQIAALSAYWEPRIRPDSKESAESYAVVRPDGTSTGVVGPRWLFHLLGLRHRAAHIAFRTTSGLIVLQQRSATKVDWPDMPDMAVAGHIPQHTDGRERTYEEGAWKEIAEEVGLEEADAAEDLVEGCLIPVGTPYVSVDTDVDRNPPFFNVEARQLFAATLTGKGLSRLRFTDHEVSGILLVTPDSAWSMLCRANIASGMRYSLPRYLDWLAQQQRDAV